MKFRILILSVLMAALGIAGLRAQTEAQFTQFYEVPSMFNPAAIGRTDYVNIRAAGRLQWVGVDGAPKTFTAAADMPFKVLNKRFGTGLTVIQESIGLYKSLSIGAQIGYKLRKWGGEFTGAIQLGMYDQHFDGTEIYIPDGDDYHQGSGSTGTDIPNQELHGTAFDIGAGLWYAHKYWQAGVSATHLTSPVIKMGGENGGTGTDEQIYEFRANRTLYFMAMGNIPVKNTLFELMPALQVKTDFTFTTAEVMARARYNKFLSFGVGYRWDDALLATVAAEFKNFYIGYSFDYATGSLHSASSGSHEVVLGYRLKLNMGEKNRNRHKSIRIM